MKKTYTVCSVSPTGIMDSFKDLESNVEAIFRAGRIVKMKTAPAVVVVESYKGEKKIVHWEGSRDLLEKWLTREALGNLNKV